jgi:hypothetical protein
MLCGLQFYCCHFTHTKESREKISREREREENFEHASRSHFSIFEIQHTQKKPSNVILLVIRESTVIPESQNEAVVCAH